MTEPTTWGIDPSVNYPVLAEWPSGRVQMLRTNGSGAERLADLGDQWAGLISEWASHLPTAVFIERVRGKYPKDALVMAVGVIEAVTWTMLDEISEHPTSIFELSPGEWKSHAVGNGGAKKPAVMAWAREHGYQGKVQDEADALGIACAGSRLLRVDEPSLLDPVA